ncbi:leucine-rich repeat and WD repeat-containing protein 1-like [Asterias rubens]|uniref:leucine-rich repeat and WD repeat-containing protein 1-like n=1 Tax=Asterias rubens TaxID=7604 RepID=UPI001455AF23|nr:leucine-rich repeat and WD repeat-containing protein 1-like [Asterias rubens]XP_033627099.1 leucine-rich repeat and WD repeat-containing protein 1-like [Asterias rubens]XP_033627100.1 leucine-rich repeat and WD repeat-containing protein 1-like [Asterias rubens]
MSENANIPAEPTPTEPDLVPPAEEAAPILQVEPAISEEAPVPEDDSTPQLLAAVEPEQTLDLIPEAQVESVPVLQPESVPEIPAEAIQNAAELAQTVTSENVLQIALEAVQAVAEAVPTEGIPEQVAQLAPQEAAEPTVEQVMYPVADQIIPVEIINAPQEQQEGEQVAEPVLEAVLEPVMESALEPAMEPVLETALEPALNEVAPEPQVEQTLAAMPTLEPPSTVQPYNPQHTAPAISPPKITSYTAVHTTTGIMRYTPGIMSALAGKYSNSSQLVEQLVLNCAGCISLSDIRVLDMSNRKIMNLDPAVFSRMPELEELDISFNKIKGFPTQLGLRKLRYLNLKKNSLKSVLTLEQFPNLEELNIDENDLNPPDQYIAVYLLPKLKKLNGKDVDIRDTIQTMEDTLRSKMLKIWEEEYAARNEMPLNKAETRSLETEFVERLKESIQYGPGSLVEFTHHMLSVLAEKHVTTQTAYWRKTVPELISTSNQSPSASKISIKLPIKAESPTPDDAEKPQGTSNSLAASLEAAVKESDAELAGDAGEETPMNENDAPDAPADTPATPKQNSPAQAVTKSPRKITVVAAGSKSPAKTPTKATTLKRAAASETNATNGDEPNAKKAKEGDEEEAVVKKKRGRPIGSGGKYTKKDPGKPKAIKTEPKSESRVRAAAAKLAASVTSVSSDDKKEKKVSSGYEVIHMLRCHSMENDPTDAKTNVWKCAFEPSLEKPGTSKWTVASCGGNTVCVIDCSTGKVLKKYQHAKDKEEFYCVAWTTIPMEADEEGAEKCNILAVAGTRGSVKLLHTSQLLCYSEIKGDRRPRPINSLLFHPVNSTWLMCGSEDIIIWDIGIPEGPDYKCKTKKMYHLAAPGRVLGLVALPSTDFILAGCENGCYGWRIDNKQPFGKKGRAHSVEFLLPSKARLAEAIKGDEEEEEGEGDMIDGLALLNDKLVASKVACDGAIHVWNLVDAHKKKPVNKEVAVTPQCTLKWCDSDSVYLDIGTWQGCGTMVSGDDEGKIWVYDTSKLPIAPVKTPTTRKPTHLLYWPDEQPNDSSSTSSNDHIIINDVAISSDCKYIVSVTNRNVICIWRKL